MKGTMSITASEVYFEVDEDNADYKKLEPQVRHNFFVDFNFENMKEKLVEI